LHHVNLLDGASVAQPKVGIVTDNFVGVLLTVISWLEFCCSVEYRIVFGLHVLCCQVLAPPFLSGPHRSFRALVAG
jgi:hypothetical protein